MVVEIPPLRISLLALILVLVIPAFAQANERFIEKCESGLSFYEHLWFERVLGTKNCREISDKISKMKSFEEILPSMSMRPAIITLGLKLTSEITLDSKDIIRDLNIKRKLFPDLDIFQGFSNLKHISLIEREFRSPCEVMRKFPDLRTMSLTRNAFFAEGVDDCLSYGSLKGVYLRDGFIVQLPGKPASKKAEIIRTKTHVLGVEYWNGSFKPLTNFPYLKYLHFQSTMALKGSGIEALGSNLFLTHLLIDVGTFHDIQQLRHLKELRSLKISGKITDLSFLKELQWLKQLSLQNNLITDLSPLRSLTYLQNANFKGNKIKTLPDLSHLKELRELNLSFNKLESLESFTGINSLETLNLSGNSISDFTELERAPNLLALNISANNTVDKLSLPVLPKLRVLSIDGSSGEYKESAAYDTLQLVSSQVSKSTAELFPVMHGKYSESCDRTPSFRSLENLQLLPELEVLTLRNQNLERIPDISGLRRLRYLNLFGNSISKLPEIKNPSLKFINLTGNNGLKPESVGRTDSEIILSEMILVNLSCHITPLLRTEPYPPL